MDKYGVTKYGFRRKLFSEILQEKREKAKEVFGENIDLSNTSFLGLLLENQSEAEATIWEDMEKVYLSAFVDYGTGSSLDASGKYITISRRPAIKSKGFITIEGDDGMVVNKGFRVATETGIIFETREEIELIDGKADVAIISIGAGQKNNVMSNSITKIVNPVMGIDKVYNAKSTEGGMDVETDEEFRARYNRSVAKGGGSTTAAIEAALLDMSEVVDAYVIENDTMLEVDGIPAKSVASYVFGADDTDVAETILKYKAGGIQAFGETYLEVEDEKGKLHQVGFTRPEKVDIYVKLSIKPGPGMKDEKTIKRAVLNYIGGIDEDGIEYKGLRLRQDVVITRVIAAVACLGGIDDIKVELSTDGELYSEENIFIETNQIAMTEKVVVNYDL